MFNIFNLLTFCFLSLQVRSSLFAAGCFSELADDFASVVLEILVNMLASSETLAVVKVAAAQIFSKMGCSYSIAYKAYKVLLSDFIRSSTFTCLCQFALKRIFL